MKKRFSDHEGIEYLYACEFGNKDAEMVLRVLETAKKSYPLDRHIIFFYKEYDVEVYIDKRYLKAFRKLWDRW